MAHAETPSFSAFLSPKYWPTWLGIGLLSLIAWLPYRLRMLAGTGIGMLSYRLAGERRYITRTNIRLCFPELDEAAQRKLVRRSFVANGIGLIETVSGWVRSPAHFRDHVTLTGLDTLLAAKARGKGVLMLGAHYSTLDFSANLLSQYCPFAVTYRPHKNALFDAFMQRGRLRNCNGVFDRYDIRGAFRHLKKGEVLWYAPDQDYGPEHAVFATFFGQRAATITTPSRFARMNGSPVVMVRHHRKEHEFGYELEFTLLPEDYPGDDEVANAALVNRALEQGIRHYPHQYLWMHKRFKTQPGGKPESPYIAVKTHRRTLGASQYESLLEGARPLAAEAGAEGGLLLASGLRLRRFPGRPGRLLPGRHPAIRLDRRSKALRLAGFGTLTVDSIFEVPSAALTAVTYFAPGGRTLAELLAESAERFPLQALLRFFDALHDRGFVPQPQPGQIVFDGERFSLLNPLDVQHRPGRLRRAERRDNLALLCEALRTQQPAVAERVKQFQTGCEEHEKA